MKSSLWVVAACLLLSTACSQKAEVAEAKNKAAPAAVEVEVAKAIARPLDESLLVTGSLFPDETVAVSSEVPGRVERVHVDFGQSVQKGQVLVELDTLELRLQLDRARAALAQSLARVGLTPSEAHQMPETTPSVRQAEASLRDAQFKYENARKLVASGDISQDRFQELENMYRGRQAALDAARDEFRVALANIQSLKAEVALAEERVSDAVVRAPFAGAVDERMVSQGQYVKENTPMLRIVKTNPLRLRADVPEIATPAVKVGGDIVFTTNSAPGREFRATVTRLDPQLEAQSRSLVIEARLRQEYGVLRPGMFVQVLLTTAQGTNTVLVPKESLYRVAGLTKVFTIEGGKAVEHRIAPGREWNGWVEAPNEIKAGDTVATSNLAQLVNGMDVEPKPQTSQAAPASGKQGT